MARSGYEIDVGRWHLHLLQMDARTALRVQRRLTGMAAAAAAAVGPDGLASLEGGTIGEQLVGIARGLSSLASARDEDLEAILDGLLAGGRARVDGAYRDLTPESWPDVLAGASLDLVEIAVAALRANFPDVFDTAGPRGLLARVRGAIGGSRSESPDGSSQPSGA